jgi:hypothetical protein
MLINSGCQLVGDSMSYRIADELTPTSGTRCLGAAEVVASGLSYCVLALGERSRCGSLRGPNQGRSTLQTIAIE